MWRKASLSVGLAVTVVAAMFVSPVAGHGGEVHLRSVIEETVPANAFASFDIIGDDTGLFVTVQPGVEFELPGYQGEPYLRAPAVGVMQVNVTAPTHFLNLDVFGDATVPDEFQDGGTVTWLDLPARSYAFHDHRVHWMSSTPPTGEGRVFDWEVPFTVDTTPHVLVGFLTTFDDEFPPSNSWPMLLVGFALGSVILASAWKLAARRQGSLTATSPTSTPKRTTGSPLNNSKVSKDTKDVTTNPKPSRKPRTKS